MEVFAVAAESGSFAAAAAKLAISPQMVAKQVQMLEQHLGVRLLNRTTRRQSLTDFGHRYLDRCKFILEEAELADSMASEVLSQPKGRLRISAPVNFGAGSFMTFLQEFLAQYPQTEIDLSLSDKYVDLVDDGYEAVIRIGEVEGRSATSLVARQLHRYQLILCASPEYIQKHGAPVKPEDLIQHQCLCYLFGDRSVEIEWTFTKDGKAYPAPLNSRLRVNDMRALINAAVNGEGIVLGAEDTLKDHLKKGELVRVLVDYEGPSRQLSLVYRADRQQTAHLKAFIAEVIGRFGFDSPSLDVSSITDCVE